jgi:lysozyme
MRFDKKNIFVEMYRTNRVRYGSLFCNSHSALQVQVAILLLLGVINSHLNRCIVVYTRRLLLLFILCPAIVFGQTRRKAIADSFKAATDLHDVSKVLSKYSDTKVEHLQVADNGEYVTITVQVRVTDDAIPVIPPLPVAKIQTDAIVIVGADVATVPSIPDPVVAEVLMPLALNQISIGDIVARKADTVFVPPLPDFFVAEALTPLEVTLIRIGDVVARKVNTVSVPPLPEMVLDALALQPLAAVKFAIPVFVIGRLDAMEVPDVEEKKIPVSEMHLSAKGYSLLEKMEGFSPELYSLKDGGLTIGFGFFVPDGQGSKWDKGITWEEAEIMIRQKMPLYEGQVKQYINVPLTQEEFDALTMMAYNLGGFSKATSIVNDINSYAGFDQLQKDWMRFVHSKAPGVMKGLMNRRRDEMQVRGDADYQDERKVVIFKNKK